jgi:hypothetical protein
MLSDGFEGVLENQPRWENSMLAISRSPSRVAVLLLWLPLFGVFCGCGSSGGDTPDLGEVTGVVTLDGKPLPDVLVIFEPLSDDSDAASSMATTDEQGRYELEFDDNHNGAVIGRHSVQIFNVDEAEMPVEDLLPEKFNLDSDLTREVKAGPNEINIDLQT